MILDSPLPTTHNETELAKSHMMQLLEDELNNRFQAEIAVLTLGEDRQHFFRLLLGRGKEPRPGPCCGDYCLPKHSLASCKGGFSCSVYNFFESPVLCGKFLPYYPLEKTGQGFERTVILCIYSRKLLART